MLLLLMPAAIISLLYFSLYDANIISDDVYAAATPPRRLIERRLRDI